jgi:hypothetical protein
MSHMRLESWTDPAIIIPAAAGLIGAAVGGLFTIWAASRQTRLQFEQQKREAREAVARQMEGLKFLIKDAKTPPKCTAVALRLREFFVTNPERLNAEPEHREFFEKYLTDQYWTDAQMLGFWTDADNLKP